MVMMEFPLNYGQSSVSYYKSKGLYSGTVDIRSQGMMVSSADAYGKMVLPSGDTLSPVLRVKTVQTIEDLQDKAKTKALETCKWYSKGYRYPVFETVRNINIADSMVIFSTAFFYPPQDHLYLDTDPENQALLDELWNIENKSNEETAAKVSLENIMDCKVYPNPVVSTLNLEYELKEDARVSFELYSMDGMPVRKAMAKIQTKGRYYETMDCSGLSASNYVLRINADDALLNLVIIKK